MKFITCDDLAKTIGQLPNGDYRDYLKMVCEEGQTAVGEPVG